MADTVFRVQVGAQIQTSTVTLRSDIQNILNDIGKRNPPKITVGLSKTATKAKLTTDLNDLLAKQNIGITLGLKGGSSLRGSSGARITKELIGITSQLSQHQAAKITLHLDTAASQKAMLAELKKLNLGVNITPQNNNGGGGGTDLYAQAQKQVVAMQAQANAKFAKSVPLDSTSQQYQVLQAQGQRLMQQAQQLRDAYLQSADAQKRGITQQDFDKQVAGNNRVKNSVDRITEAYAQLGDEQAKATAKAGADQQNQALDEYKRAQKQVAALQAQANAKFAKSAPFDSTSQQYQTLQDQGQRLMQQAQQLRDAYLQSANAQKLGITQQDFDKAVAGNDRVRASIERAAEAQAKFNDKTSIDNTLKQGEKLRNSLNENSSAGAKCLKQLQDFDEQLRTGKLTPSQYAEEIKKLGEEAEHSGAMAESAGQKFSRMLGEKIGYGAIALLLAKVRQALGEVYTNVVNIDAAMTELKKVTDETASAYDKFLSQSGAKARELGSTVTDVVNATAGFARLGYNLTDSAELAETAIVYNNVGDGIASIDDATESVISTMQAFNITAQDSMSIADKFNQIGRQNCPAA